MRSSDEKWNTGSCKYIHMPENTAALLVVMCYSKIGIITVSTSFMTSIKKLHKISCTAVVRRKIQFGLCVGLTCCQ